MSNDVDVLFSGGDWSVVRCRDCGVIRQWPPTAATYDNLYPSTASPRGARIDVACLELCYEVADYHVDGGRVLDIGCSYGDLMGLFDLAGGWWRATGIDVCKAAVHDARSRGLDCRVMAVEDFVPEEPYDAAVMNHVLEHVADPVTVLKRVRMWLKPGGTLHIRVPNVDAVPLRKSRMLFVGELKPGEHLFYYSAATLRHTLRQAGFDCEIRVGGRYSLGAAINAAVRYWFVRSARWRRYNCETAGDKKKVYFLLRRMYEAVLSVAGWMPLSHDRELRVVATRAGDGG